MAPLSMYLILRILGAKWITLVNFAKYEFARGRAILPDTDRKSKEDDGGPCDERKRISMRAPRRLRYPLRIDLRSTGSRECRRTHV